jgi:arabinose-5-phosphate isomerase
LAVQHDDIATARAVIEAEAAAILNVAQHLDASFTRAVAAIVRCPGRLIVAGIGKAGLIGLKISATFASTGTPSFFLHPAEGIHGDLGRVRREDIVLLLSNSGESDEVLALIDPLKSIGAATIGVTGNPASRLAACCDDRLLIGAPGEACPLGLAPTSSTAALLALGDALAMAVLQRRGFNREDYARFHPGGKLGRSLMKVDEIMRRGAECTTVAPATTAHAALLRMNHTPGRPGAACVLDEDGVLVGFISDGDIVRALEHGAEFLHRPVAEMMITRPKTIPAGALAAEAARIMREHKIDQLPVVDGARRALGLIDLQDLIDARIT